MCQYFIKCQGKEIAWSHLVSLYEHNRSDAGLSLIPKLKFEHIHLTTFSKMRVDLAARALCVYIFTLAILHNTCACIYKPIHVNTYAVNVTNMFFNYRF